MAFGKFSISVVFIADGGLVYFLNTSKLLETKYIEPMLAYFKRMHTHI